MMVAGIPLRCSCSTLSELTRVELEPGLPASGCPACEGSLLALADYKAWRDSTQAKLAAGDPVVFEDAPGARACPNCARLMHRLRAGARPDFRLDRCVVCQAVWFDSGEWPALIAAGHAARLDDILTDAWQRQVQADELRANREAALRERHGDACIDELGRIRSWLDAQPRRDELIALLRAGW
jgi:Zn-finger nucleic acid-binding protein